MPCQSYTDAEISDMSRAELDRVTALLCEALTALEHGGRSVEDLPLSKRLRTWWTAHKKHDAQRIKAERAEAEAARERKKVLATLTKKQRRALGV